MASTQSSATLVSVVLLLAAGTGQAERVAYTDRGNFIAELQALSSQLVIEGFEDDAIWGAVRSTITGGNQTAPQLDSQGLAWRSNHVAGEITTSEGAARSGQWGVYSLPHGAYASGENCDLPGLCGDGFVVSTTSPTSPIIAAGGWIDTNTPFAKIGLFIDGDLTNGVDFGEVCDPDGENCEDLALIGTQMEFFGIIDPAGFTSFEFRELEGTAEDQKFVFADDFVVGLAAPADGDADGISDAQDNCTQIANPDQRDSNGDGYGNVCDPDLDDNGAVDFDDLALLKSAFFGTDDDSDFDGDGSVNFNDLAIMKEFFFGPPGPSGAAD